MPSLTVAGWISLIAASGWALRSTTSDVSRGSLGWRWWALVGVTLLCFRWPLLWIPHELNADEGHFLGAANTLRYDPLFWRSVDGITSGPLVYYPLLPAAWGNGLHSYAIARLIGLFSVLGTLIFAGESLATIASRSVARAAILPGLAFEAFTTSSDFLFYSSEAAPVFLLAATVWLATRRVFVPTRLNLWAVALLLGALPWSKLQAAPIAVTVWLLVAAFEFASGRARSLGALLIGGLLPSLIIVGMTTLGGQADAMAIGYLFNGATYVGASPWTAPKVGVFLWQSAVSDRYLGLWLTGFVVFAAVAVAFVRNPSAVILRWLFAATVVLAVSAACILAPRRPFTHYLHLLELPLTLVGGAAMAMAQPADAARGQPKRMFWVVALFLMCCLVPQLMRRVSLKNPHVELTVTSSDAAQPALIETLRTYTTPGEALAIWGWRSSLYVEAGLRQATRQGQSEHQIYDGPRKPYFLRRYFDDLTASNPPVFVDAVGPGNFLFEDRRRAHESFPPLRDWVRLHYTLVVDAGGTRVYVRNDRLNGHGHL